MVTRILGVILSCIQTRAHWLNVACAGMAFLEPKITEKKKKKKEEKKSTFYSPVQSPRTKKLADGAEKFYSGVFAPAESDEHIYFVI